MKAHIKGRTYSEEKEMSRKELADMRIDILNRLAQWFKWADYYPVWKHLVYYVEFNGEAYLYPEGWLCQEGEFDELVAMRQGVTFAGVLHRR